MKIFHWENKYAKIYKPSIFTILHRHSTNFTSLSMTHSFHCNFALKSIHCRQFKSDENLRSKIFPIFNFGLLIFCFFFLLFFGPTTKALQGTDESTHSMAIEYLLGYANIWTDACENKRKQAWKNIKHKNVKLKLLKLFKFSTKASQKKTHKMSHNPSDSVMEEDAADLQFPKGE